MDYSRIETPVHFTGFLGIKEVLFPLNVTVFAHKFIVFLPPTSGVHAHMRLMIIVLHTIYRIIYATITSIDELIQECGICDNVDILTTYQGTGYDSYDVSVCDKCKRWIKIAYDKELDNEIWSKAIEGNRDTTINVKVMRYNQGQPKIQLLRTDNQDQFMKLGRITKEEVEKLIPALQEAIEQIEFLE